MAMACRLVVFIALVVVVPSKLCAKETTKYTKAWATEKLFSILDVKSLDQRNFQHSIGKMEIFSAMNLKFLVQSMNFYTMETIDSVIKLERKLYSYKYDVTNALTDKAEVDQAKKDLDERLGGTGIIKFFGTDLKAALYALKEEGENFLHVAYSKEPISDATLIDKVYVLVRKADAVIQRKEALAEDMGVFDDLRHLPKDVLNKLVEEDASLKEYYEDLISTIFSWFRVINRLEIMQEVLETWIQHLENDHDMKSLQRIGTQHLENDFDMKELQVKEDELLGKLQKFNYEWGKRYGIDTEISKPVEEAAGGQP